MNVLQLKVGGPLVREWQQKALSWQLAHPSGTAEECLDWMKETHSKRIKMDVTGLEFSSREPCGLRQSVCPNSPKSALTQVRIL
ncbi:hypothetical protein Goklo_011717 [Gossypium klotzschianum]|uniref:Uncharacterized protein n=1 Tax=Gossypium klotzschianum TaxID=34286 RepID=A0A7J8V9Y4_9ROSI|nr:hypothetical protein [Gossypium klotzschianum]